MKLTAFYVVGCLCCVETCSMNKSDDDEDVRVKGGGESGKAPAEQIECFFCKGWVILWMDWMILWRGWLSLRRGWLSSCLWEGWMSFLLVGDLFLGEGLILLGLLLGLGFRIFAKLVFFAWPSPLSLLLLRLSEVSISVSEVLLSLGLSLGDVAAGCVFGVAVDEVDRISAQGVLWVTRKRSGGFFYLIGVLSLGAGAFCGTFFPFFPPSPRDRLVSPSGVALVVSVVLLAS